MITDATDGASFAIAALRSLLILLYVAGSIVIFGAPGSIVSGNTITQKERVTMGGTQRSSCDEFRD